jgi:hypothetical protein
MPRSGLVAAFWNPAPCNPPARLGRQPGKPSFLYAQEETEGNEPPVLRRPPAVGETKHKVSRKVSTARMRSNVLTRPADHALVDS